MSLYEILAQFLCRQRSPRGGSLRRRQRPMFFSNGEAKAVQDSHIKRHRVLPLLAELA
jgi:hypothetical protein